MSFFPVDLLFAQNSVLKLSVTRRALLNIIYKNAHPKYTYCCKTI